MNYKDLSPHERNMFNYLDSIALRVTNKEKINIFTALLDKYLSLDIEKLKGGIKE